MNAALPLESRPFDPAQLRWTNRYAQLGKPFAHRQPGQALPDPRWVVTSDAAAAELGWPSRDASAAMIDALAPAFAC